MTKVIVGVGGGGSMLAYFLSKTEKELILIDHDKVEAKNLERQLYCKKDIGKYKVKALAAFLSQYSPQCKVTAIVRKIENKISLADINPNLTAIAATDNIKSKRIICDYFEYSIAVGSEKDYFEITDIKDRYNKTWEVGSGYESTQTFESNLISAAYLTYLINMGVDIHTIKAKLGKRIIEFEG